MKFEIGDRVRFVNEKATYGKGDHNPLYQKYGIVGTVVKYPHSDPSWIKVLWDNKKDNSYKEIDLAHDITNLFDEDFLI